MESLHEIYVRWEKETLNKGREEGRGSGSPRSVERLEHLRAAKAKELYAEITEQVFHGAGGLELWHLSGETGEIGLRVSAPTGKEKPYFAVINIGDVASFEKHVKEHLKLEVKADKLTGSLFDGIEAAGSPVHLLIGAKKFT